MNGGPRYSIITTCKGRWHHLVESLPALLRQPDSEVIVVDYDCPDKTADHVARDFPAARVVRVTGVTGFNASHARNVGAAEARSDTLVFVDADVVISDQFIPFVDENVGENAFAKPQDPQVLLDNSMQGTCVVHKRHFNLVGGYDEVLQNYGGEDLELYERLATARVDRVLLSPSTFIRVIEHGQDDRGRFFEKGSDLGFLIGKVYRVAKDMMIRVNGSFDVEIETRQQLYDEIIRLVQNMERMERKELNLEVKFPDNNTRGLHQSWEFLRSINLRVRPRSRVLDEETDVRHSSLG
jgi:glycosyltransferase involved in cell wall biosynthesis